MAGGHLVDSVGMRACIVGFSLLVLLGQALTALGCSINSMAVMLLGTWEDLGSSHS